MSRVRAFMALFFLSLSAPAWAGPTLDLWNAPRSEASQSPTPTPSEVTSDPHASMYRLYRDIVAHQLVQQLPNAPGVAGAIFRIAPIMRVTSHLFEPGVFDECMQVIGSPHWGIYLVAQLAWWIGYLFISFKRMRGIRGWGPRFVNKLGLYVLFVAMSTVVIPPLFFGMVYFRVIGGIGRALLGT
jgi:hypothetical protein